MFWVSGTRLFLFLCLTWISPVHSTVVKTVFGKVRGLQMTSSEGRNFHGFRGIPYAKPPTNELRFQDPVEAETWTGVLDATREGPMCLQYSSHENVVVGTEDCLTLNIYTHNVDDSVKRPVMVWIHGGAFYMGSGNGETDLYGPSYLMDRNIVLVTINYRLGPMGFLSTDDHVAPGNYGLLDQSLALRWVKNNIEAFGGDPDSITIFGESAGGASVEYQVLAPRSAGLFHRAIAQSGSALCNWAWSDTVKNYTLRLALHLNCPVTSSEELVECLRSKKAEDIVQFRKQFEKYILWPIGFGPRTDKERKEPFLPQSPQTILETGAYRSVPFITGANQNEAAFMIAALMSHGGSLMAQFENNFPESLSYILCEDLKTDGPQKALTAFEYYFGKNQLPSKNLLLFERMLSDSSLSTCVHNSADLHRKHSPDKTYAYWYSHRGQISFTARYPNSTKEDLGVSHGDELFIMFHNNMFQLQKTVEDQKMTSILLDYWTTFASEGSPSSSTSGVTWLPLTQDQFRYLNLNTSPALVDSAFLCHDKVGFWNQFYKMRQTKTSSKTEL